MKSRERETRLLLVDDETDFLQATATALSRRGFQVTRARDGTVALAHLRAREFDVAVLDVKMPGIDGVDLFHRIKRDHRDLPVILLTGHATVTQAFQTSREGVYEYLAKPCDIEQIAETAHRAARSSPADGRAGGRKRAGAVEHEEAHVLLVGGDEQLVRMLKAAAGPGRLRLAEVANSDLALERLDTAPVDVVVADWGRSGPGAVRLIQEVKAVASEVEVVVVVGELSADQALALLQAGAFALLRKPLLAGEAVDTVRSAYRLRRKRQAEERDRLVERIRERYPD